VQDFSVLVSLFIPFRRGDSWANWTIFLGGIVSGGLAFLITFKVHLATNASTPWYFMLLFMALILLGFLFSLWLGKEKIKI
jgi:protein-S-isoprenylcysteine O-methyltransferase Ste14